MNLVKREGNSIHRGESSMGQQWKEGQQVGGMGKSQERRDRWEVLLAPSRLLPLSPREPAPTCPPSQNIVSLAPRQLPAPHQPWPGCLLPLTC